MRLFFFYLVDCVFYWLLTQFRCIGQLLLLFAGPFLHYIFAWMRCMHPMCIIKISDIKNGVSILKRAFLLLFLPHMFSLSSNIKYKPKEKKFCFLVDQQTYRTDLLTFNVHFRFGWRAWCVLYSVCIIHTNQTYIDF